jgi:hypothetical protein
MQPLRQHWLTRTTGLLLLAAGLVGCGAGAATEPSPTAEACVIEEYTNPNAVMGGARMQPDPDASPAYCTDEAVLEAYREAMELTLWYGPPAEGEACTEVVPPASYPDTLIDDLTAFYTGDLLHNARETIYYNQAAMPRRLVLACWDVAAFREQFESGSGDLEVEWHPEGRQAIVKQTIQDYTLLTYEIRDGQPELIDNVVDEQAGNNSFWDTTMVYDGSEGAQRWKITQAQNILPEFR